MYIIRNRIKCNLCNEVIESKFVHDFQACACGSVNIDGGRDYLERGYTLTDDYTELSKWKEEGEGK